MVWFVEYAAWFHDEDKNIDVIMQWLAGQRSHAFMRIGDDEDDIELIGNTALFGLTLKRSIEYR